MLLRKFFTCKFEVSRIFLASFHAETKFLKFSGKVFPKLFFSSSKSLIKQNGKKHSKKVNFNFTFDPIWAELQASKVVCMMGGGNISLASRAIRSHYPLSYPRMGYVVFQSLIK